jgi:hypothetical protein
MWLYLKDLLTFWKFINRCRVFPPYLPNGTDLTLLYFAYCFSVTVKVVQTTASNRTSIQFVLCNKNLYTWHLSVECTVSLWHSSSKPHKDGNDVWGILWFKKATGYRVTCILCIVRAVSFPLYAVSLHVHKASIWQNHLLFCAVWNMIS